jgi:hypothetical protein
LSPVMPDTEEKRGHVSAGSGLCSLWLMSLFWERGHLAKWRVHVDDPIRTSRNHLPSAPRRPRVQGPQVLLATRYARRCRLIMS